MDRKTARLIAIGDILEDKRTLKKFKVSRISYVEPHNMKHTTIQFHDKDGSIYVHQKVNVIKSVNLQEETH